MNFYEFLLSDSSLGGQIFMRSSVRNTEIRLEDWTQRLKYKLHVRLLQDTDFKCATRDGTYEFGAQ